MTRNIVTSGPRFEAIQTALKRRNAKFRKLTRAQQRIAIAKDVIAQVKVGRFVPTSTYFEFNRSVDNEYDDSVQNLDMSNCIAQASCQVCGIGSLFAGAVINADKLKLKDFNFGAERDNQVAYLKRWFTSKQLDLIETVFERWYEDTQGEHHSQQVAMPDIVLKHSPIFRTSSKKKRLLMIMENIISNKGTFDLFKGRHKI